MLPPPGFEPGSFGAIENLLIIKRSRPPHLYDSRSGGLSSHSIACSTRCVLIFLGPITDLERFNVAIYFTFKLPTYEVQMGLSLGFRSLN